ncbi:MAG: carboxypeptidase regulatory-like domain-containing protein [Deltaproteobacteria bacterium]|nr:MAG: carboxypeptidase regulatory-like domain-containing protein [Deltaproteobacteria bacterium]
MGTGCALIQPPGTPNDNEQGLINCSSQRDCLPGQNCIAELCTAEANNDTQAVSVQLIPPNNHNFKSEEKLSINKQQWVGVTPKQLNGKVLRAWTAYTISGKIYAMEPVVNKPNETEESKVPARIRFIGINAIPGLQLTWEVSTDPRPSLTAPYQHNLSPGEYIMEVWPQDASRPPHRSKVVMDNETLSKTPFMKLDLELPAKRDYPKVTGQLLPPDYKGEDLPSLRLQVMNANDEPLSKIVETNSKGEFSILMTVGGVPHHLRIYQRDTNGTHPQVDIPFEHEALKKEETIELGKLTIGISAANVRIEGTVQARQQDGGYPIPDTSVRILGELDVGQYKSKPLKGSYLRILRTDSNGRYSISLPQGKYNFEAIPPGTSDRSRAYIVPTQSYFHADRKVDLELSPKRRIVGKICEKGQEGSCSATLSNAQIQALWRSPLPQTQSQFKTVQATAIPVTPFRTQLSRTDGTYEIALDPGYYDFVYVPPTDSGLARLIRSQVKVDNDSSQPYIQFDAILPQAKHVVGQVLGPDGLPLPNTTVELYSHSNNTAQLLGRAITNSQGFYSIPYNTSLLSQSKP